MGEPCFGQCQPMVYLKDIIIADFLVDIGQVPETCQAGVCACPSDADILTKHVQGVAATLLNLDSVTIGQSKYTFFSTQFDEHLFRLVAMSDQRKEELHSKGNIKLNPAKDK